MCKQYSLLQWRTKSAFLAFALLVGMQSTPASAQTGPGYFPNIPLTTQDGVQVRFYDDLLKGKSVAINVIYTSCTDECPLETARMAEVQRLLGDRMGRDIRFYSISIDPENDTPKRLKAYAEKFGVGPGWLFLTGPKEDNQVLTKKLGLSRSNDAANKDGHASMLMLGNEPSGQWMRNSAVDNPRFLAATMNNFFGWKDGQTGKDYAEAHPVNIGKAQFLFQSRCASCHTVGGGDGIGPDLNGVTQRRDPAWLAKFIMEPEKMLAEGDPTAMLLFKKYKEVRMPNLRLSDEDVTSLVSFLDARSKAPEPPKEAREKSGESHSHHHH
jgi:protein SCO1/2